jgi:hypothetical protein
MDAAVVFNNLMERCDQIDHILPTAERQVRPMTKLEPWQQQKVRPKPLSVVPGISPKVDLFNKIAFLPFAHSAARTMP